MLIFELEQCLETYGSSSERDVKLRKQLGEKLKQQVANRDIVLQCITEVKNSNNIDLPRLVQYCDELISIVLSL